jgi:hypothetical protein
MGEIVMGGVRWRLEGLRFGGDDMISVEGQLYSERLLG